MQTLPGTGGTPSRRSFLAFAAASGLGIAGCSVRTSADKSDGGVAPTGGSAVIIPDGPADLPKDKVTIRLLSGGPGPKTGVFKTVLPAYHRKHPNLTIAYDELPNDKIAEVLPIQLRNGNADTVFPAAGNQLAAFVAAGQLAPLDDIIPDFDNWSKAFPFGILVPGVNQFGGKTYSIPPASAKRIQTLLLYNTRYLEDAGVNPKHSSLSWAEFRSTAKKITRAGKGQYYGFMTSGSMGGSLGTVVGDLAQLAGALGGGFNWKTGRYEHSSAPFLGVLDLLMQIKSDGSFLPGWVSLTDQQIRAKMPQGIGGMMLNGPWNYPGWARQNPTSISM